VHPAIRYSSFENRAPAQRTRISRLKHGLNKNRASCTVSQRSAGIN